MSRVIASNDNALLCALRGKIHRAFLCRLARSMFVGASPMYLGERHHGRFSGYDSRKRGKAFARGCHWHGGLYMKIRQKQNCCSPLFRHNQYIFYLIRVTSYQIRPMRALRVSFPEKSRSSRQDKIDCHTSSRLF